MRLVIALALLSVLPLAACGADDDLVTAECKSACDVRSDHPCYAMRNDCLAQCRATGDQALANGFKSNDCAKCQIGLVEYSVSTVNADECWGVVTPTNFGNDTCKSFCVDPNL